jgi:hypothetical protein
VCSITHFGLNDWQKILELGWKTAYKARQKCRAKIVLKFYCFNGKLSCFVLNSGGKVFFGEINDFCEIFLFCKPAVIKIILAFNIFFVDSVSSLEINEILE